MKKIIKNKVYDTATAKKLGEWYKNWDNSLYRVTEELYQKRTGEFFLYGCGGPGSKYGVSSGNGNWSSGEEIIPMSYEAAQEWAEKYLDGEEYEAIFGEVVEDDTKTMVAVYLPTSKVEGYKRNAAKEGLSLTAYLEGLLDKDSAL